MDTQHPETDADGTHAKLTLWSDPVLSAGENYMDSTFSHNGDVLRINQDDVVILLGLDQITDLHEYLSDHFFPEEDEEDDEATE